MKSGLSWRRVIALTSAKRLISKMENRGIQRRLQIERKRLTSAPKPGSPAARAWAKALANLKERARKKNPAVYSLKQLKDCVRSAKTKLVAAKNEVGKMRQFVSTKRWRLLSRHRACLEAVRNTNRPLLRKGTGPVERKTTLPWAPPAWSRQTLFRRISFPGAATRATMNSGRKTPGVCTRAAQRS